MHINEVNRRLQPGTGFDPGRPAHKVGNVNPTLKEGQFPAAIGLVEIRQSVISRGTVVGRKYHQGIVVNPVHLEGFHNPPDTTVQSPDHRGINPEPGVLDMGKCIVIRLCRLQGSVGSPVSQVKEEGAVFVGCDNLNSLIRIIVGNIAPRLFPQPPGRYPCERGIPRRR